MPLSALTRGLLDVQIESGDVRELPLFPLGIVLNPGASTPLHIFEMRYRLLFNRIQDRDNTFGLIFYNRENNLVARVGCAAMVRRATGRQALPCSDPC